MSWPARILRACGAEMLQQLTTLLEAETLTTDDVATHLRALLTTGKPANNIRQLEEPVRAELDRLLRERKFTISEITLHLRSLGAVVSRSAIGRYSQRFDRVAKDIRMAREMATAMGKELELVDGDTGRLAIESLQALVLRCQMQIGDDDEPDQKKVAELARAAKDLQLALRANVETELKIRERVTKEAIAAADDVVKRKGLSDDVAREFRERLMGVKS